MKKKELQAIAKKIAMCEKEIEIAKENEYDTKPLEETIFSLTKKVTSIEDMLLLDEFVLDFLEKNKK